jgi:GxxExxY protein
MCTGISVRVFSNRPMKNAYVSNLLSGDCFRRQVPLPIVYKDVRLDCGYRMDVVVENELIIEIKAVDRILPVHEAQMLTYLRLARLRAGLLMNFNNVVLKDGLRRFVL